VRDNMKVFFIAILLIVLTSCTETKLNFDEIVKSLALAEKEFNNKGYITATASQQNEYVKFQIMVKDRTTNENAKELAEEFINTIENQIKDKELFKKSYLITFDFKSEKDGNILFNGKRDKGTKDIWWQF
jgi:hypothetical protein